MPSRRCWYSGSTASHARKPRSARSTRIGKRPGEAHDTAVDLGHLPQLGKNQLSKIAGDTVEELEIDRGAELDSADRGVERADERLDLVPESSAVERPESNLRTVSFGYVTECRESALDRYAPVHVARMLSKSETFQDVVTIGAGGRLEEWAAARVALPDEPSSQYLERCLEWREHRKRAAFSEPGDSVPEDAFELSISSWIPMDVSDEPDLGELALEADS